MEKENFEPTQDPRFKRHEELIRRLLPRTGEYGYYALHSFSVPKVDVPEKRLRETFLDLNRIYTESLTHGRPPDTHPDGYSRRYETKETSGKPITSQVTTCYFDGHIVTDGYVDIFCEGDDGFNPNWFIYKIQRHLQLSKEIFEGLTPIIIFALIFRNIDRFKWEIYRGGHISEKKPYVGYHGNIIASVDLSEIYGRDHWNVRMNVVEDILARVARIFGLDSLPQPYWNEREELDYPQGISGR